MLKIGQDIFEAGQKVAILEDGKVIDEVILRRTGYGGSSRKPEIEVESTRVAPGKKTEFVFFPSYDGSMPGWRTLFEDPMAGGRCYSERGPLYVFKTL